MSGLQIFEARHFFTLKKYLFDLKFNPIILLILVKNSSLHRTNS